MADSKPKLERLWLGLFGSWLLVSGATLGSLFFSEVMNFPPCSLCWYQRIFMFPLPIILLMGLFPFDAKVIRYALPLSLLGCAVALFHTLLQLGIISQSAAPCRQGVSCSDTDIELFGFVSIPMLSLLVFFAVSLVLILIKKSLSRK